MAVKIASDALDVEEGHSIDENQIIEEVMNNARKLMNLDLEEFARQLSKRKMFDIQVHQLCENGAESAYITLCNIREELINPFEDRRPKYRPMDSKEKFELLTKENSDTLDIGTMVQAKVNSWVFRKPNNDAKEKAIRKRHKITGYFDCPFCDKQNFIELNEVWHHFDNGCQGYVIGINCELTHNGIRAFLSKNNVSDSKFVNVFDRISLGMTVQARVIKVDYDRMQVEISSKLSDIKDRDYKFQQKRDNWFDESAENKDLQLIKEKEENEKRKTNYIPRVIYHPSFKNVTYDEFVNNCLPMFKPGDFLIRPSSKVSFYL